ncbi:hypothetical protein AJ80_00523 [Polytolypa hystricis UAMH7299]|uniref:Uncharacterized protein n=1 Tax=Polytolypa hystricis (strain UAMH7299) TaxID=1447883 RepID=A0A2B7Z1C9_POLH7|nr:hypothetical protein AJ80_00523 [Polytolypa hystricis UAMH7299]
MVKWKRTTRSSQSKNTSTTTKAVSSGKSKSTAPTVQSSTTRKRKQVSYAPSEQRVKLRRTHRLALGGNTRSQKTLTQIDFVKRLSAQRGVDDAALEYIDEAGDEEEDVYEKPTRSTRKLNKEEPYGTANAKFKKEVDADDTLTQMGYVNAMPSVGDGEEVGKRYTTRSRSAKKKKAMFQLETIGEESTLECDNVAADQSSARKRRKQDHEEEQPYDAEAHPTTKGQLLQTPKDLQSNNCALMSRRAMSSDPSTPQKPRRLVVPSSQSPDTPEILLNTSFLQQTPPRFPLAPLSCNSAPKTPVRKHRKSMTPVKIEDDHPSQFPRSTIPESPNSITNSQSTVGTGLYREDDILETTPATSPPPDQHEENEVNNPSTKSHEGPGSKETSLEPGEPPQHTSQRDRRENIVYETDAESDNDDFYDAIPYISDVRPTQREPESQNWELDKTQNPDPVNPLPTQARSSTFLLLDSCDIRSSNPEPSLLYYRKPMSYPVDPTSAELNAIGPERMAELFPASLHHESTEIPLPPIPEENEDAATQLTARDQADISTLFIPESSQQPPQPLDIEPDLPPPSSPPVILVESSQPEDMEAPAEGPADDGPRVHRKILTPSQLLTESLMESIPGPALWISSDGNLQDEDVPTQG